MEAVDPAQHLALAHRVIGQMGLYGDMKEEAYSESLVLITEAAQSFDPSKGVPVAAWLAKNIRWGLATWISKQKTTYSIDSPTFQKGIERENGFPIIPTPLQAREASEEAISRRIELSDLLGRMQVLLTSDERLVLLYHAVGYKGIEIAKMSGMSPVQISLLKTAAQKKLRQEDK